MDNDKSALLNNNLSSKQVLTTGDIAKLCNVHFRTVIRWIERGRLKAYKLPGRGNNRVEVKDFILFLNENNMPIPAEFTAANKRILIVDDDVAMSNALQRVLKHAGYETKLAGDGFQAGDLLASFRPALMTLDLNMPNMDGFSVLKYIRSKHEYKNLKIVVISALDQEYLDKAMECGAHQCLTKPFENQTLLDTVKVLIDQS